MIKRLLNFETHDWKHLWWLVTRAWKGFWDGDYEMMFDALHWISFHIKYDSKRID